MDILALEPCPSQRGRLRCALDLTGQTYTLREIQQISELETTPELGRYRLALIGSHDLSAGLPAVVYLRGRMPTAHLIAYGEFQAYDQVTPKRLRDAGADVVLDARFSASKMALIIERFLWREPHPDEPNNLPHWALRQALRQIAPAMQDE